MPLVSLNVATIRLPIFCVYVIRAVGLIAVIVGVMVLFGWIVDSALLKTIIPGANTMKVNTAFSFLLIGLTLLLYIKPINAIKKIKILGVIGRLCGSIVFLVGFLTFLEHIFNQNFGIDELLIRGEPDWRTPSPGRFSLLTAINFTLLGLILIFADIKSRTKQLFIKFALLFILSNASLALLGYLTYPEALFKLSFMSSMALHTALLFVALSIVILCARSTFHLDSWRYGLAVLGVTFVYALYLILTAWLGAELPPFLLFFPAILFVALLAGFGPGLFSTALSAMVVTIWIFKPVGVVQIDSPVNQVSIMIFCCIGIFICTLVRTHQTNQHKIAVFEHEQALQQSRREAEFLGSILDSSSQPFAVGYPDGRLGRINQAFEELTGYTAAELRELRWSEDLTPLEWRTFEDEKIAEIIKNGQVTRYEKEYIRKDGVRVPVELLVHLVRNVQGQPEYFYSFITNIKERKETEAVMESLNVELELRVKKRTDELQILNQSLESFVYSVSHDLKTPLRGIEGYSRLLQEDYGKIVGDEGKAFLQNICTGVKRMNDLIDDLLAYSRMSRRDLQGEAIDINLMVKTIVQELNEGIAAPNARFDINLPPIAINADKEGVAMVLRNLINNALKFSQHSAEPKIEVGATHTNETVKLWIKDNGIGFDMKYVERIFEIFQRLNHLEDYPGTGIGLALVKMTMQRMGGHVWAQSTSGQGAVFYLTFKKS